jgi:CRP-like cAMP-binding protein
MRWQTLRRALRHPDTWVRMAYGVIWTLALIYAGGRLTDTPPWSLGFWETNGLRVSVAISASLAALGAGYLAWEFYYFLRRHARRLRRGFRLWRSRWFGGRKQVFLEGARLKAVADSPLFRTLPPPERQQLARVMQTTHHGAWRSLPDYGPVPAKVSLIVSGTIGLYRRLPTGHIRRVQVLGEGDVVGLHDLADPKNPDYLVRTLSPVTLLTLDRATAEQIAISRMLRATLTNTILKLPFLRRISLCKHWHLQAIERFAHLSTIIDFPDGAVIFPEDQFNQEFFIIFERDALVSRNSRRLAVIHAGDFFGEIGLLQNSVSNARVSAKQGTRCLTISRIEFLRFVTHNYTVALELERVSSRRLGRPIFPLQKGNFRAT